MKKLKKSYVIPVCVIGMMLGISICLNTDCFGVIHRIVEKRYPQAGMDLTDWTGKEAILYDFKVNEDQSVTSTSNSGWLVFFFENYGLTVNNLRSIDLYVDHTDIAGTHFNVYTVEGYAWNFAMLKTGRIEIPLDSLKDSDMGIRLDMGLSEGINFKFDRIVFNDTEKICKDLINKGNGLLLCVAILGLLGAAVVLGRKYKKEIRISAKWLRFFYEKCIRGKELLIGAAFVLLTETLLVRWSEQNLLFLLPLTASAFLWGRYGGLMKWKNNPKVQKICAAIKLVPETGILVFLIFSPDASRNIWLNPAMAQRVTAVFVTLLLMDMISGIFAIWDADRAEFEKECSKNRMHIWEIFAFYVAGSLLIKKFLEAYGLREIVKNLQYSGKNGELVINFLLVYICYLLITGLLGQHISNVLCTLTGIILVFGNVIKIKFQNNMLAWNDLKVLKEAVGIADAYVNTGQTLLLALLLLALAGICIWKWKKIVSYLKYDMNIGFLLVVPVFMMAAGLFQQDLFIRKIMTGRPSLAYYQYTNNQTVSECGPAVYYFRNNFLKSGTEDDERPENYGKEIVENLKKYKKVGDDTEHVENPNVILIMAEALCDITSVQGEVTFSQDPFEKLRELQVSKIVSPCYGGRTVMSEYEALTGLSNYLLGDDRVAYTSYIDKKTKNVGSIAQEFKDNGYETVAMHPNLAEYYNRDVVYNNFGFDRFMSIEDFQYTEKDLLLDRRMNDDAFMRNLIEEVNQAGRPSFIFGVTFAGHSPYAPKYENTVVKASSSTVTERQLEEAEKYAQTVYEFGQAVKKLKNYIEKLDEPTIVYIFGDHLPALSMFEGSYLNSTEFKYTVPLLAFSNYKEVTVEEEYLSANQIAAQIIKDSGIAHRSYFDFIYRLREKYPVLQKEWSGAQEGEEIDLYRSLQYDLLFGQRYALENGYLQN